MVSPCMSLGNRNDDVLEFRKDRKAVNMLLFIFEVSFNLNQVLHSIYFLKKII